MKKNENNNKTKKQKKVVNDKKPIKTKKKNQFKQDRSAFIAQQDIRTDFGDGVRGNIMIIANVNAQSIQNAPAGVISYGYTKGWFLNNSPKEIYWAYVAMINDLKAVFSKQQTPITGRPHFLNSTLGTYASKEIPFKTGTITYSWNGVDSVVLSSVLNIRNFNFYMYKDTGLLNGSSWIIQGAPMAPGLNDDIALVLSNLFTLLENPKCPGTKLEGSLFTKDYLSDASGYAQIAPYYGRGNSNASSASGSVENEVPFRSQILAVYNNYNAKQGRVARNYRLSSGDSTVAYGLGFLDQISVENYNTVYPIIYKFIDLDEVVNCLCEYFISLVSNAIATYPAMTALNTYNNKVILACKPFNFTAQQFRITVRQHVLAMFADTQPLAQFMTYSESPNGFEGLRVGSNCYAALTNTPLIIPTILNENLRCLKKTILKIPTKFSNKKNKQIIIPVWGTYQTVGAYNPECDLIGIETESYHGPLFLNPPVGTDPRITDCVDQSNNVLNVNSSKWVKEITQVWNGRMNVLQGLGSGQAPMGGAGRGELLTVTRSAYYVEKSPQKVSEVDPLFRGKLNRNFIVSKKTDSGVEDWYVPNGSSLFTQYTKAFTSLCTISETLKQNLSYFILPTIIDEGPSSVPTVKEFRTATLECNIIEIPIDKSVFGSRGEDMYNLGTLYCTGIAGRDNNEGAATINENNTEGVGGFFGDLVGALGPMLPF